MCATFVIKLDQAPGPEDRNPEEKTCLPETHVQTSTLLKIAPTKIGMILFLIVRTLATFWTRGIFLLEDFAFLLDLDHSSSPGCAPQGPQQGSPVRPSNGTLQMGTRIGPSIRRSNGVSPCVDITKPSNVYRYSPGCCLGICESGG